MQYVDGKTAHRLAEGDPDHGPRAAACPRATHSRPDAARRERRRRCCRSTRLTKTLRRLHCRQRRLVRGRPGRDPRPDRPERLGQEHHLQPDRRRAARPAPARCASRATRSRGLPPYRVCHRGIGAHLPDPAAVPQALAAGERRRSRPSTASERASPREKACAAGARGAATWSACRPSTPRASTAWARPA